MSPAHRGDTGPFPRPENQPEGDAQGDKVEAQSGEDLIDAGLCFEKTCHGRPEASPDHSPEKCEDQGDHRHGAVAPEPENPC